MVERIKICIFVTLNASVYDTRRDRIVVFEGT